MELSLSPRTTHLVLRSAPALLVAAHSVTRIASGTIPRFGAFLGTLGFPQPVALVWLITITELTCAVFLVAGRFVPAAAAGLAAVLLAGIPMVHWRNGWFVGEFATGGMEYSVSLLVMLGLAAFWPREAGAFR